MGNKNSLTEAAWKALEESVITYNGLSVGTVAARDSNAVSLNYDQCFTRDFAVSALAFLMCGKTSIVRNFLVETLALQSREKMMDCFRPGQGLMPASFKVEPKDGKEELTPDFGEHAIARVAPVDSGFWWMIVLRAYVKASGDMELAHQPKVQQGLRFILDLYLTAHFEMFPTLLVPDGSFMIDRRMGVYGHPLDIQSLFFAALLAARELLVVEEENESYILAVNDRLGHLASHVREYYWLDPNRIAEISQYDVEEYGESAVNKFNIYPDSIPDWLTGWLNGSSGYFAGNLGPGRMDFRFFTQGNLMAIISSLASDSQAQAIMGLIEKHWEELVGHMPMKIVYPTLEGREWGTLTGCDPKNTPWSYHNGGSWPFLLWLLSAAALKTGRKDLAQRALDIAKKRLHKEQWPEYYDGQNNCCIGKQARKFQTWTIAGFIAAEELLNNPDHLALVSFDEGPDLMACSREQSPKNKKS